jgi:hypothetical protein
MTKKRTNNTGNSCGKKKCAKSCKKNKPDIQQESCNSEAKKPTRTFWQKIKDWFR